MTHTQEEADAELRQDVLGYFLMVANIEDAESCTDGVLAAVQAHDARIRWNAQVEMFNRIQSATDGIDDPEEGARRVLAALNAEWDRLSPAQPKEQTNAPRP